MNSDIITAIEMQLPALSKSEQLVARAVLDAPEEACELTIGQLAQRAGSSEATVTRFCRSVGLVGYAQLRMRLAVSTERRSGGDDTADAMTLGDFEPDDPLSEIVKKIAFASTQALEITASQLDLKTLAEVVETLRGARQIVVFGAGSGAAVAQDAAAKLIMAGCSAVASSDVHMGLMAASRLGPDSAVLAFSHSGRTREVCDVLNEATSHGAATVVVTSDESSPAGRTARYVLRTAAREMRFRSGGIASRIAQLTVVDCIFVAMAHRDFAQSMEAMESMHDAVSSHVIGSERNRA